MPLTIKKAKPEPDGTRDEYGRLLPGHTISRGPRKRKKELTLASAARSVLASTLPDLDDEKTVAEVVCETLVRLFIIKGDVKAVSELRQLTETAKLDIQHDWKDYVADLGHDPEELKATVKAALVGKRQYPRNSE